MRTKLFTPAIAVVIAGVLISPLLYVIFSWWQPDWDTWSHLSSTVLSEYIVNSILLAFIASVVAAVFGTINAYIFARYQFWGKRFLLVLQLLPLAMPAYIIAYTYTGILDISGPLQSVLRTTIGLADNTRLFGDIRNLYGASIMLGLVLYPYVFMLARQAFIQQSGQLEQVSALAKKSAWQHFIKVDLPLARPAILTGAALVMMESLADYGTVAYFGVNTFSTGIYRTWFGLGNQLVAAQLASLLCVLVFVILFLEQRSRGQSQRYALTHKSQKNVPKAAGAGHLMCVLCALLLPLLGFFFPVAQLAQWAFVEQNVDISEYIELATNSLGVSALAGITIVLLAMLYSWLNRQMHSAMTVNLVRILSLGYALPGIVIAVGVVVIVGFVDRQINYFTMGAFDYRPGLILSGGLTILVFAYAVRYLSVALQNTETSYQRIDRNTDKAALLLNPSKWALFRRIHVPLLTPALLTASLLVFVDVLKELPATLVLRPFGFNTLAVKAYELASDEKLAEAALPAISIVIVGLIPVILLMRQLSRNDT